MGREMNGIGVRGRAKLPWVALTLAVAWQGLPGRAAGPEVAAGNDDLAFVYFAGSDFSKSNRNAIGVYRLSAADGGLTPVVEQPLEKPGPLAVHAENRRLYAVNYPDKIQAYEIDPTSGGLKSLAEIQLPGTPEYISVDRRGRCLLAAMYHQQQIVACPLDDQGRPQADRVQALESGTRPHAILGDRHGKFVYVPCDGEIWQYAWREDGTGLADKAVARHKPPKGKHRPRHLWFHPTKDWLYVVNERSCSLTFFQVDPDTGGLRDMQTLPTVPENTAGSSGADVHVTPDGRFVYASTRGHDSIAGFAIDQKSGEVAALGQTATARGPRDFAIDPRGRFVVAGGTGRRIVVHAIDQETGRTTTKHSYEVHRGPVWVEIVGFPRIP